MILKIYLLLSGLLWMVGIIYPFQVSVTRMLSWLLPQVISFPRQQWKGLTSNGKRFFHCLMRSFNSKFRTLLLTPLLGVIPASRNHILSILPRCHITFSLDTITNSLYEVLVVFVLKLLVLFFHKHLKMLASLFMRIGQNWQTQFIMYFAENLLPSIIYCR